MELSISDLRELMNGCEKSPFKVNENVFVRTVSFHYVGRVSRVCGQWLQLSEASWVADSGRWHEAVAKGSLKEVEPYPADCWINLGVVVDWCVWSHRLPRDAK